MIRRRSIVGLALLAAFAFMAISASGASAAWTEAKHTTAVTCVSGGTADFSDSHCDNHVTPGTGSFGHATIAKNVETEIETVLVGTAHLRGTLGATSMDIACTSMRADPSNKSFIENTEPSGTEMKVHGTIAVEFTGCSEQGELAGICEPVEPITLAAKFHGIEEATNSTMGLEFEPDNSTHFAELHYKPGCPLGTGPFNITGSFKGTSNSGSQTTSWSGATVKFEGGAMSSLVFGGNAATFEATFTTKMTGGNPIALTTG